jgi:hypothetical protein
MDGCLSIEKDRYFNYLDVQVLLTAIWPLRQYRPSAIQKATLVCKTNQLEFQSVRIGNAHAGSLRTR